MTEKELVRLYINGESTARDELYRRYAGKIYALCLRYARCRDDADDIFQEAFYKVYTNLHTFGFNGSLEGWIRRIFINTAVSHYRNEIRTIALSEVNETEDEPVDNEPDLLKNITAVQNVFN